MTRSLTLVREILTALTDDDLAGVVGAGPTLVACITDFTRNTTCLVCE